MKRFAALALSALLAACSADADVANRALPAPLVDVTAGASKPEVAVLAGGCFWGMQGVFEHVKGVTRVVAGFAGGRAKTATYDAVSTETTGHAESVEITFDPKTISYGELLRLFFSVAHDPTQLNRQGPDVGPSYRSAIFYANAEQERVARAYIAQLNAAGVFASPIVTKLEPLHGFFPAGNEHQDYLIRHPKQPYIVINDLPKIAALKRTFPERYREEPVRVDGATR